MKKCSTQRHRTVWWICIRKWLEFQNRRQKRPRISCGKPRSPMSLKSRMTVGAERRPAVNLAKRRFLNWNILMRWEMPFGIYSTVTMSTRPLHWQEIRCRKRGKAIQNPLITPRIMGRGITVQFNGAESVSKTSMIMLTAIGQIGRNSSNFLIMN